MRVHRAQLDWHGLAATRVIRLGPSTTSHMVARTSELVGNKRAKTSKRVSAFSLGEIKDKEVAEPLADTNEAVRANKKQANSVILGIPVFPFPAADVSFLRISIPR